MQTEPIPPAQTTEDRATQFVPVEGSEQTTSAEALLVAAYLLMWALVLIFLFLTWRRQRQLEGRLLALESQVKQAAGS